MGMGRAFLFLFVSFSVPAFVLSFLAMFFPCSLCIFKEILLMFSLFDALSPFAASDAGKVDSKRICLRARKAT